MSDRVNAGARLDRLPICRFHYRMLGLIGSGLFLDSLDLYVQGLILAYLVSTKWSDLQGNARFLSATFLGLLVGTLISGPASDRFGRRLMYQLNLLVFGIASIAAAFAPSLEALIVCRFVMGIGLGGEVIVSYGTLAEFTPPEARARWQGKLALLSNFGIPISALLCGAILPGFGWRPVFALIGVLALLVWTLRRSVPESPRWYESRGRDAEAEVAMEAIEYEVERSVHAPLPPPAAPVETGEVKSGLFGLFQGRLLRRTLLAIFLMICANTTIYTFVAWFPTIMTRKGIAIGNTYFLAFVIQLGALPGALIGAWAADWLGRRRSLAAFSLASAAFGLAYGFAHTAIWLALSGFLVMVLVYSLVAITFGVYVPEIFPTPVRMTGSSVANACGRLANVFSPQGVAWMLVHWGELSVYAALAALLGALSVVVWIAGEDTERRSLEEIGLSA